MIELVVVFFIHLQHIRVSKLCTCTFDVIRSFFVSSCSRDIVDSLPGNDIIFQNVIGRFLFQLSTFTHIKVTLAGGAGQHTRVLYLVHCPFFSEFIRAYAWDRRKKCVKMLQQPKHAARRKQTTFLFCSALYRSGFGWVGDINKLLFYSNGNTAHSNQIHSHYSDFFLG